MEEKIKKPFYKKVWFWAIAVIIIAIGCSLGKDDPKKVGQTSTKVEQKKKEIKGPKIFKVGDIIQLNKFKVSVNKVYKVEGNEFSKPKNGNEFIAVDCTVENISEQEQTV